MYNLKVYTSNIYVANYRDTVANHGSVFSRNNLHFRSCIFTNCMFLIARHYHWRKAVSNKREIALLKKIQLVSKRRDNFKCWVLLLLFLWYYHHHIHICCEWVLAALTWDMSLQYKTFHIDLLKEFKYQQLIHLDLYFFYQPYGCKQAQSGRACGNRL